MSTNYRARAALPSDIPRLVAMNRAAYPELVADGVVFDADQLTAHQSVFPEGQKVCLDERGEVVGAFATLVVHEADALGPHDWVRITGHGTFSTHVPRGSALYLADVYSDPRARGRGVGASLYAALFQLCRDKGLGCVVAGGRLAELHASPSVSAQAYVDDVVAGRRRDSVLSSQLRAGFEVRGVLSGYLEDWRSRDYASLLVWTNDALRSDAREGGRARGDARGAPLTSRMRLQ